MNKIPEVSHKCCCWIPVIQFNFTTTSCQPLYYDNLRESEKS